MRAVARICATTALLALVVVGFSTTVKVCGPDDARARELPPTGRERLVTAMPGEAVLVAEDGPPIGLTEPDGRDDRYATPADGAVFAESGGAALPEDGTDLTLNHLSVWDSPDNGPCVYLSFMPVSVVSLEGAVRYRKAIVEGEEVDVADIAPVLDETHVRVTLDGAPVAVTSLQWYYAGYGDLGGADTKYMPVCLVRVERPDLSLGTHSLRVEIEDVDTGATGASSTTFTCGTRASNQL